MGICAPETPNTARRQEKKGWKSFPSSQGRGGLGKRTKDKSDDN